MHAGGANNATAVEDAPVQARRAAPTYRHGVPKVVEVARCHQTVAAVVAGAGDHEHTRVGAAQAGGGVGGHTVGKESVQARIQAQPSAAPPLPLPPRRCMTN